MRRGSRGPDRSDRPLWGWGAAEPQPTAHGHEETWGERGGVGGLGRQADRPSALYVHTESNSFLG